MGQRQSLIRRHGPSPSQIVAFPPARSPFPDYTIWDFFPGAFSCPHELERVGPLGNGGRWTCGLSRVAQKDDCAIYVFQGQSWWDSSWEAEVLEATQHCQFWGYGPLAESFGNQTFPHRQRTHFTSGVMLDSVNRHAEGDEDYTLYTLESLMERNGHSSVDILMVLLGGNEFSLFKAMVQPYVDSGRALPFGQLQIDLHVWGRGSPSPSSSIGGTSWRRLGSAL